jgi:hypothetical protein
MTNRMDKKALNRVGCLWHIADYIVDFLPDIVDKMPNTADRAPVLSTFFRILSTKFCVLSVAN